MNKSSKDVLVRWKTLLNRKGEKSLKQHGFIRAIKKNKIGREYEGNISLCGQFVATKEGPEELSINEIEDEPLNVNGVCQNCMMRYE